MHPNYLQILQLAAPETILVLTMLVVLAADLLFMAQDPAQDRFAIAGGLGIFGCVLAIGWLLVAAPDAAILNGMLVSDPLTRVVKIALLACAIFTILISMQGGFTTHVGEYFALLLLATIGMLFMVGSEEILMIFISLELTSLSLYILTAFNKRDVQAVEAGLKYFLFGGMAAAFTLFGLSLVYGLTGATNLSLIAAKLRNQPFDPLLAVAIVMTVIGFGFKIAAVPFHLWAPDAYQGAPTPSAAFIASGSKVASFFLFTKVMTVGFHGAEGSGSWGDYVPGWIPIIAVVAALSMVLGNVAAIAQNDVKRLLAYSAIAHAGYALLGILTDDQRGLSALVYYVVTYALTALGAFGVVAVVESSSGNSRLSDFAGLSRRAPLVSFCMLIFMLSLAGIPPLAGFFGKFYIFAAAVGADPQKLGLLWLVILAIAMSVVSLYYYLQVLKQIYVADVPTSPKAVSVSLPSRIALVVLAVAVLMLGSLPHLVLSHLTPVTKIAGL
jgi:NADH-quinone oxidoreductase subunit N